MIPVLVVDSNIESGEHIKRTLEARGQFKVTVATRAIEALMRFTETRFQVAVIDFGLPDLNGIDLISQMVGIDEDTSIIAVLEKGDSQRQKLKKLSIEVVLDRSTYLKDLKKILINMLELPSLPTPPDIPPPDPAQPEPEVQEVIEPVSMGQEPQVEEVQDEIPEAELEVETKQVREEIPPWLKDPTQVQDYLLKLGKEHSAFAWLLSRGATPWNFSETITEKQAHGIVRLLSEHDEGLQSKGALIRYIRLSGTGDDYLLYATPVVADINLTLIFSMETPFSVARRQSHKLSRLLAEEDPKQRKTIVTPAIPEELIATGLVDDEPLQPSDWIPASKVPEMPPQPLDQPEPVVPVEEQPSPDPIPPIPTMERQPDVAASHIEEEALSPPAMSMTLPSDDLMAAGPEMAEMEVESHAEQTSSAPPPEIQQPSVLELETEASNLSDTDESTLPSDWLPQQPKPVSHLPFLEPLPETPEPIAQPDPVNVALQEPKYFLPFTAILLPRFPNHKLIGSVSNQLELWLNDLCIAWGWRMSAIDIRPEFLRFTLLLSPDVAPAQSVQSLAQNLSTRILQAFPGMSKDLPSGQFWTKSYLLTAGSDVGKGRLDAFIETTRKEQGLTI